VRNPHVLEGYDIAAMGFRSTHSVRLMVEAMRRSYLGRTRISATLNRHQPLGGR